MPWLDKKTKSKVKKHWKKSPKKKLEVFERLHTSRMDKSVFLTTMPR
jgi:hypothetical protein